MADETRVKTEPVPLLRHAEPLAAEPRKKESQKTEEGARMQNLLLKLERSNEAEGSVHACMIPKEGRGVDVVEFVRFMTPRYKNVGITARSAMDEKEHVLLHVIEVLEKGGASVHLDPERCTSAKTKRCSFYTSQKNLDLLIVLGGDGTILRAVRELTNYDMPILPINRGTLGFLSELSVDEIATMVPFFLKGHGKVEERKLLKITATRGKKVVAEGNVLNEAVIAQGAISRLIDLETTVNGDPLTTFHADGVILATPTGSTAYSLAAGGPVVHPKLAATIVTPINPHSFTQKPIVLPGKDTIDIRILTKENKFGDVKVSLTLDGQTYISMQRDDIVRATIADETVKFLRRHEETYFGTLRNKLKWGERLEEESDS